MKKKYAIFALAALSMVACSNEEEFPIGNETPLTSTDFDPVILSTAGTRANMGLDLAVSWEDGDAVGIFSQWDKNKTGTINVDNGVQNARFQFFEGVTVDTTNYRNKWLQDGLLEGTLTTATAVRWNPDTAHINTKYNFYTYFPYVESAIKTAIPFQLSNAQQQTVANKWHSTTVGNFCNFMYSTKKNLQRPADRLLPISLVRLLPVAEFDIVRDDDNLDGYYLQNIVLTADGLVYGNCSIDLTQANTYSALPFFGTTYPTPSYTLNTKTGSQYNTGIKVDDAAPTGGSFNMFMSVNPFTVGAHTAEAIFSNGSDSKTITVNMASASYTISEGKGNIVRYVMIASKAVGASVDPTGIEVIPSTLTLRVNGTGILTAKLTPDNVTNTAVTWSSASNGIATVDANGKVKGIAVGNTTITATDAKGHTAQCAVTVQAAKLVRILDLSTAYRVFSPTASAYNSTSGQLLFCTNSLSQQSVNTVFAGLVPVKYEIVTKAAQPTAFTAAQLDTYDVIAMSCDTEYYLTAAGSTMLRNWLAGATNRVLLLPTIGYAETFNASDPLLERFIPGCHLNTKAFAASPVPWQGVTNMVQDSKYVRAQGYPSASKDTLEKYGIIGSKNPILEANPGWELHGEDMVAFNTDDDVSGIVINGSSTFTPVTYFFDSTPTLPTYGVVIDFQHRVLAAVDSDMWGGSNSTYYNGGDYFGMPRIANNNNLWGAYPASTASRAAYCYTPFYANPYGSDITNHTGESGCADCSVEFIRACRTGRIMMSGIWAWVLKTADGQSWE